MLDRVIAIIPARNEEGTIADIVSALQRTGIRRVRVVDNGSTDGTAEAAWEAGAEVILEPRPGYGQACRTGTLDLPPDVHWILFCDADGSDDLEAIPEFLAAAQDHDLILGNRMATAEGRAVMSPAQRFGNWLAPTLLRLIFGHHFQDLGPMRLIRRETYEAIGMRDRGFGWTVEMQARACELHASILEIPVRYFKRRAGVSKISGNLRGTFLAGTIILATLGRFFFARFGMALSLLPMVVGGALTTPHGDLSVLGNVPWFLSGFALAGLGYIASSAYHWTWLQLAISAVLIRLLAFPMEPGTDAWRYLWEGMIQWHGHNPYLVAPDSPLLDGFGMAWRTKINHPDLTAGYPPLTLLFFAATSAISTSVWWLKSILVAADLAVCQLLARRFGPGRAAWYALSPLVVSCYAGGAHFDSLLILPMVLAWFAWDAQRPLRACAWLGLAIGIKYVAAPLLAFVLWRLLREGKLKTSLAGALLGLMPAGLALAWFWMRDGVHPLAPAEMIESARSAEFLPRIIGWIEPRTVWQNRIFAAPFALVALILVLRRRSFAKFAEDVFLSLLAISPAVHAWYFTWALPFACASGNLAFRVAGLSAGIYFILEHRQAAGDTRWRLTWLEWALMWGPTLGAFAYTRWRERAPKTGDHPHLPEVAP